MSLADELIGDLDVALAEAGQPVTLRRLTLAPSGEQISFSVDCNAGIRAPAGQVLVDRDAEPGQSIAILSPTPLRAGQWPGPGLPPLPAPGDLIVVADAERVINSVKPFYIGTDLVRIEAMFDA